jgi:hypothetical protein
MPDFHPDRPKSPICPPSDAKFYKGTIWRGVKNPPISEEDFKSHAERNAPNCDRGNCEHWGLSIWISEEAVKHARELHPKMIGQRWHIAAGDVNASDGKIMATPSDGQPDHHTFWKYHGHSILSKFKIVMPPLPKPPKPAKS